jgi:hypothetical protein
MYYWIEISASFGKQNVRKGKSEKLTPDYYTNPLKIYVVHRRFPAIFSLDVIPDFYENAVHLQRFIGSVQKSVAHLT